MILRYDPVAALWKAFPRNGSALVAKSVSVDARAVGVDGALQFDEVNLSVSLQSGHLKIERAESLPGHTAHSFMRPWVLEHSLKNRRWQIHRRTARGEEVVVSTNRVEINCMARSQGGNLVCLADMIANGRTNRTVGMPHADSVFLRTKTVHNQTVKVKSIRMFPQVVRPG